MVGRPGCGDVPAHPPLSEPGEGRKRVARHQRLDDLPAAAVDSDEKQWRLRRGGESFEHLGPVFGHRPERRAERQRSHAEEQHSHGEECEPSARQRIAARDEPIAKNCNEAERPVSEEARYDGRAELMETDDRALFDTWTARWADLADFEIVPVLASADAAAQALR